MPQINSRLLQTPAIAWHNGHPPVIPVRGRQKQDCTKFKDILIIHELQASQATLQDPVSGEKEKEKKSC